MGAGVGVDVAALLTVVFLLLFAIVIIGIIKAKIANTARDINGVICIL